MPVNAAPLMCMCVSVADHKTLLVQQTVYYCLYVHMHSSRRIPGGLSSDFTNQGRLYSMSDIKGLWQRARRGNFSNKNDNWNQQNAAGYATTTQPGADQLN